MGYTVFIYEGDSPVNNQTFSSIQDAFAHMGKLDFEANVRRCILDDGSKILFDLSRDKNGCLSTTK